MIPQHLSNTPEHPSPPEIVEAARYVLGGIDLDPASSREFNKQVRARKIFTEKQDGLARPWSGRVYLNPPGGSFILKKAEAELIAKEARALAPKMKEAQDQAAKQALKLAREPFRKAAAEWETRSRSCAWWRKLTREYEAGRVESGIFLSFTLELLRAAQASKGADFAHPLDFAVCYPRERLCFRGNEPTHANLIVYLGPNVERFLCVFSEFGRTEAPRATAA